MSQAMRLAVVGAAGRMGRQVLEAALSAAEVAIVAAVVRPGHPWDGQALGACIPGGGDAPVTSDLAHALTGADVVVDFSLPAATPAVAAAAAAAAVPLVVGTTGITPEGHAALAAAARRCAVVVAPNTSVGVAVLKALVAEATRRLGPGWDAEILELHHRLKRDSPSGTADALGEALAQARGGHLRDAEIFRGRGETGPRAPEEIGVAALRGGGVIGEHTVFFFGDGERLELTHRAADRGLFARGALRAARFARDAAPGLYGMGDVLAPPAS